MPKNNPRNALDAPAPEIENARTAMATALLDSAQNLYTEVGEVIDSGTFCRDAVDQLTELRAHAAEIIAWAETHREGIGL